MKMRKRREEEEGGRGGGEAQRARGYGEEAERGGG